MDRLVDPTLADLQAEYENAASGNRKWESRRILLLGHVALIRVMAVHGGMQAMGFLRYSTREDRRALVRTLGASIVIMVVGTLLLMVPPLKSVWRGRPDSAELALYLVPQALPISIPVGLTFGILWGLGRVAASPRSRTLILFLATMASVASFTMLAWVVPAANQAFRVSVIARLRTENPRSGQTAANQAFRVSMIGHPVLKGANELTLGELRQRLEPGTAGSRPPAAPSDLRSLALSYYGRWALAGAPLVLALFVIALTYRRQCGRLMTLLAGCLAIFGYYVVMYSARRLGLDHTLSAFAAAWTPNVAFLILSVAVMLLASRRANEPVRT
jgi:lipopolysaccharide export LptBFGC system permease protein LptF